ncbi:unnamed protein product [Prorocentrum cordatum]|uniref:Secreted protein n=1 Tax=Prorocentrum cordatum TaxID=2364126 RepID=A0ABN9PNQ5_9DINO|nr:unnamed protein product [Polarella glacialis]
MLPPLRCTRLLHSLVCVFAATRAPRPSRLAIWILCAWWRIINQEAVQSMVCSCPYVGTEWISSEAACVRWNHTTKKYSNIPLVKAQWRTWRPDRVNSAAHLMKK